MAIRIVRNENGNCITFIGSSQPAYWNACLSGRVNPEDPTRVDIINDVRTTDANNPVFEFYAVDFNIFQDADGNSFDSAGDCARYITEKANVLSDAIVLKATDTVNFTRDPTNTSILTSLGDNFGVNAIKAREADDGTITIREFQDDSGQDIYTGLRPNKTRIEGQEQTLSIRAVVNSLNAHFSVNPVGLGLEDAVVSFLYTQETPNITAFGNATDSGGVITKGVNTGSQRNDGFHTDSSGDTLIKNAGDYFQINTTGYDFGRNFLFGLFNREGIAGGDSVFADNNDVGGHLDLGLRLAPNAAFEDGPHGVVIEEGFFKDPQNSTQFRAGMNADRRLFISHFSLETNEYQDVIRSAFPVDSGNEFMLAGYLFDSGSQFNASVIRNKLADSVTVSYRYIESPDGIFRYPLFASELEAGAVSLANGGNDSSEARLFVDDPSGSTWYSPATGYINNATSAPRDSGDIVYTEIPSKVDAQLAPAAFTISDYTFAENAAVNFQTFPQGASFSQTQSGDLPPGVTYDVSGFFTGTTPYVSKNKSWTVTLTRSNSYGSTSASFNINVTNNASLDNITGITQYIGNTIQPDLIEQKDVMDSDYGFFADIDQKLVRGQQVDWVQAVGDVNAPSFNVWQAPYVGIVDSAFDSADKAANSDTNTWLQLSNWDVRFYASAAWVGGVGAESLVGWTDNTYVSGSNTANVDKTFRLALSDSDGIIRLYRENGTDSTGNMLFDLLKTSANSYDSAQRLSLWVPSTYASLRRKIPSFTFSTIGANDSTPPAGFESPLEEGLMSTEMIMGDADSTSIQSTGAILINKLEPGKRFIVPTSWIEDNILDLMKDSGFGHTGNEGGKVFIGVPKKTANFVGSNFNDFVALNRWEYKKGGDFRLTQQAVHFNGGPATPPVQVGNQHLLINTTNYENAYYDVAIEWDGEHFYAIQCNIGDINQQPGVENGGQFSRVWGTDDSARAVAGVNDYASDSAVDLAISTNKTGRVRLRRSGLQIIDIPLGANDFKAYKDSANGPVLFGDSALTRSQITLTAGQTYRFYLNDTSIDSSETIAFVKQGTDSAYTTGVTTVGQYPNYLHYVKIAVDSAVPPIKMTFGGDSGVGISVAGSSYIAPVEGVTLEGPASQQTNNLNTLMDSNDFGWMSLDNKITAGQRLVFNSTFLHDLCSEMPPNSSVSFGLRDSAWADTDSAGTLSGGGQYADNGTTGVRFTIGHYVDSDVANPDYDYFWFFSQRIEPTQIRSTERRRTLAEILSKDVQAFIELSADGNSIRSGLRDNDINTGGGVNSNFAATTPHDVWGGAYIIRMTPDMVQWPNPPHEKEISSTDIVFQGRGLWQQTGGHPTGGAELIAEAGNTHSGMDVTNVDFSELYFVNVPVNEADITTPYSKAIDFSGGSEYAQQTTNSASNNPLRMADGGHTVVGGVDGYTSGANKSRPWAVTCVFTTDGHSSNQHIWNQGEGANTSNDNIYLRTDANRNLYFGWGRSGALNECKIIPANENSNWALTAGEWYGVYVAHTGERLDSTDAADATNLANCFDIRIWTEGDYWAHETGGNLSVDSASNGGGWITTGGGMDESMAGNFSIGGRAANRSFHGQVASCVVTTLEQGVAMPSANEARMMTIDPIEWKVRYKQGGTFRQPQNQGTSVWDNANSSTQAKATQIWLMGDTSSDTYTKIRNHIWTGDTTDTSLDTNSMVSSDIETINIDQLTD